PIEVGDHGLWIRLRYLRAEWGRTGAARGWLRVARGAAIGIERGSQTLAGLDRPGNGIYLLECVQRPTEERLFGSIERRERPARPGGTAARTGIALRIADPGTEHHDRESHH